MKETVNKLLVLLFLSLISITCFSQLKPVYTFWKDDSLLKKNYYDQAFQNKERLVASLSKEQKKEYKEIYESRFKEVGGMLKSERTITEKEPHQYLQSVLKKIIDVNPELQSLELRVVFTRDWWPNAYSMGEGTIAFNAGLFVFLNNEAELAFVLCHELAHYYLDHSKKRIDRMVSIMNSDSLKKELKRLSKQQYGIGAELQRISRVLAFDIKRHSREGEAEADRIGLRFLKRTGYTGSGFISSMKVLDAVDDTSLFSKLNITKILSFPGYPFRERWIKKESRIFGAMNTDDASSLTMKERDSLKTHPGCSERIAMLGDSALTVTGASFLVNQVLFNQLKKDFVPEMIEQVYKDGNVSLNLYLSLQMLQEGSHTPLAIYSIARDLNDIYQKQKSHELGLVIDVESKGFNEQYNELLRILSRIRLNEIAELNDQFCIFYKDQMKEYESFDEEIKTAQKNKLNHQ